MGLTSLIPGGTLTRSKAVFNLSATHASGAYIYASDGRRYLDMLCALGARSLGYTATYDDHSRGVCSLPWLTEASAADVAIREVAPWASWVRFVKTGSEATHAAYRIAKATVGRGLVFGGDWAYHGWHEWADDRFEPDVCWRPHGHIPGITFSAFFIEPHRWKKTDVQWLRMLRQQCDETGALLVFDSMIYGGRWALGGASEYFGVQPDLECFGKALGNGQSIAFVVGTDKTKAHGTIPSGTYSGDDIGLAAFCRTIATYRTEPVIETLWARGRQLQSGLNLVIPSSKGIVEGAPVHQRIRFHDEKHGLKFAEQMWQRGILWHPACCNVMYAHTEEHIEQVIQSAAESVKCL